MPFRVSEWPTKPAQMAGEPVVEYLTRAQVLARGWAESTIIALLGEPDGTRPMGRGFRRYYRLDRVLQAEQAEEFRARSAELRRRRAARGLAPLVPPAPVAEHPPLALQRSQLYERGWSEAWIQRFLAPADDYMPTPHRWMGGCLFAVDRVELVEASPRFQEEVAESRRRRAEAQARWEAEGQRKERRRRDAERAKALSAPYPGFRLHLVTPVTGDKTVWGRTSCRPLRLRTLAGPQLEKEPVVGFQARPAVGPVENEAGDSDIPALPGAAGGAGRDWGKPRKFRSQGHSFDTDTIFSQRPWSRVSSSPGAWPQAPRGGQGERSVRPLVLA
jgi:hypothetical protein